MPFYMQEIPTKKLNLPKRIIGVFQYILQLAPL